MNRAVAIQSISPSRSVTARDENEYAAAVADCFAQRQPIADYGVAHRDLGGPPPEGHVQIAAPAEHGLEHWISDLTVRIPGGMKLGELQRQLMAERQFLPIDADADMTAAEIITHNVFGPMRIGNGTLRDLLLGLRYIDGHGKIVQVGGRTVKNVAGYDVPRFLVGSLNEFGLVADAVAKTAAVPEQVTRLCMSELDPESLDTHWTAMLTSDAAPWATQWTLTDDRLRWHVVYAGSPRACDAQCQALLALLQRADLPADPVRTDGSLDEYFAWQGECGSWRRSIAAHLRLIVPPAVTGQAMTRLWKMEVLPRQMLSLPAHGILDVGYEAGADAMLQLEEQLMNLLQSLHGTRTWMRRPPHCSSLQLTTPMRLDLPMLRRLKQTMDPGRIFNPGRVIA